MQVIVHKKDNKRVPALYKNLPTPFLENDNEWCWHGERHELLVPHQRVAA